MADYKSYTSLSLWYKMCKLLYFWSKSRWVNLYAGHKKYFARRPAVHSVMLSCISKV